MSTIGQYDNPFTQTTGKSILTFRYHELNVNDDDWSNPAPKNILVNIGPKINWPNIAFCIVDNSVVEGNMWNTNEYQ